MAAVQLDLEDMTLAPRAAKACRQAGVITRAVAGNGLQISPPLTLTVPQVDELVDKMAVGLRAI
jgi:adenosylmethionine-8-amino-7-oxononanoate aminotransferase